MEPTCARGPSLPTTNPPQIAITQPKLFIISIGILKKFGKFTPFKMPIKCGSPDPTELGHQYAVKKAAMNANITQTDMLNAQAGDMLLLGPPMMSIVMSAI